MTPDRVLRAILSIFDFDIEAFFKAIINREVTINLVDGKPGDGPLGEGDPGGGNEEGEPGGGGEEGNAKSQPRGTPIANTLQVNPIRSPRMTKRKRSHAIKSLPMKKERRVGPSSRIPRTLDSTSSLRMLAKVAGSTFT